MKTKGMLLIFMLGVAQTAWAQNPDDYRGGWRTDSGDPHIYEFSIRGTQVRGVYCTRCSDATTLAFIDGTFGTDGIAFTVTHVDADGRTVRQDRATARFSKGNLTVTGTSGAPNGGKFERTVIKDPRGPDPLPGGVSKLPATVPAPARGNHFAPSAAQGPRGGPPGPGAGGAAGAGRGRGYLQPGPWKQLTQADVVGVWLGFGVGINKQYFIVKKVGNGLRGMVCGRCDNPYTMAALDDFEIRGEVLTFNILHEDWGPGSLPSHNRATVRVAANEMRMNTQMDNTPGAAAAAPPNPNGGTSLLGPIAFEATRGNP
jgi:hypothetical protein